MVSFDAFSRFTWICIFGLASIPRYTYISFRYFPPISSHFTIYNVSSGYPYLDLYANIIQYSTVGEVIVPGNFNAHTRFHQIPLHDQAKHVLFI
jgi:hypothetical protein